MAETLALIPPSILDARSRGFAAAVDVALDLDPWQACPLHLEHTPEAVLWPLALQLGVSGPLWQAMETPERKRALLGKALRLQRHRGTPWSVEEVVRLLGYADAKVLDRHSMLRYDGEALFNGAYTFDSDLPSWAHYRIRVVPGSKAFTVADRAAAALLAQDWAPLHCRFAGWEVRIVHPVSCGDPALEASRVGLLALETVGGTQAATVPTFWIAEEGSTKTLRFRLAADALSLPNIGRVSILRKDGSELASIPVPQIDTGTVLEGAFELRAG